MTEAIKINANDGKTRNVMVGGETTVDFDFPIYDAAHITIFKTATDGTVTELANPADYTVPSGSINVQNGGTCDLVVAAVATEVYTAFLNVPEARTTDFQEAGDFFADTLNLDLDLIAQQLQQLRRDVNRAPLASVDTTLTAFSLPAPIDGYGIIWDGTTGALRNTTSSLATLEGNASSVGANIANINAVAANEANINAVNSNSSNINAVANITSNITTVSSNISSVNTVATNIDDVSQVENNLSNITTVASNISGVTTVTSNIVNINTVAGISSNVTTVAGMQSDITSVLAIQSEISDAAANIPKANRSAISNPTTGDDSGDGYSEGSLWVNTTTNEAFLCTDPASGAAVWEQFGGSGGGGTDTKTVKASTGDTTPDVLENKITVSGDLIVKNTNNTSADAEVNLDVELKNLSAVSSSSTLGTPVIVAVGSLDPGGNINFIDVSATGTSFSASNLNDNQGNATTYDISFTAASNMNAGTNTAPTGTDSTDTLNNDDLQSTYLAFNGGGGGVVTVTFSGLDANTDYQIGFVSQVASGDRNQNIVIQGGSVYDYEPVQQPAEQYVVENVTSDGSGEITMTVTENSATNVLTIAGVSIAPYVSGSLPSVSDIQIPIIDESDSDTGKIADWQDLIDQVLAQVTTANFETGDGQWTFRSTAKSGWLFVQGQTLGDTGSGATLTGSTYEDLYEFFWDNLSDTYAPVSTGRGASAAADWAAGKTITIPDARDRAPFGVGTTWDLGETQGAESVTLLEANLPAHTHGSGTLATSSAGNHTHNIRAANAASAGTGIVESDPSANFTHNEQTESAGAHTHTITGSTASVGSGTAVDIKNKGVGMNYMIKL